MRDHPTLPPAVATDVRFRRPDGLALEVEVFRVEELLRRDLQHDLESPQRVRFHLLVLVERGTSSHVVDFEPVAVEAGSLLIVPEGHVHAFAAARALEGPSAVFTAGFVGALQADAPGVAAASRLLLAAAPVVHLGGHARDRAARAFEVLRGATSEPQRLFATEAIRAGFLVFLYELAGLPEVSAAVGAHEPEDPLVGRFLRLLEERFPRREGVDAYARALHVSRRTLDRRVIAACGTTARQAIAARTLLEAKRMLADLELPIKAIAEELGFTEPHNFTRFFRTLVGTPPQSFRAALPRHGGSAGR